MRDNFNRHINYLRISVTDRCNLRCTYCMPSESMKFLPKADILSYEEMIRLISIFSNLGIKKLRFTGGEPFVRKNFIDFLQSVSDQKFVDEIHITTNGVLTAPYLKQLADMKIAGLNISLDTVDQQTFSEISLRDNLDDVLATIKLAQEFNIPVKINTVVMEKINDHQITDIIDYFKHDPIELRFIEFMPFNERDAHLVEWNAQRILQHINDHCKTREINKPEFSTSDRFQLEGYPLKLGIIAGYSRTFCGTCNRIRLSAIGEMKTCLYADPSINLMDLLRNGTSDATIRQHIVDQISQRHKNGFDAEAARARQLLDSMSKIGG